MLGIVRRVPRLFGYLRDMGATRSTRAPLSSVLGEVPGCWVAVDRRTNAPVAVARSPYELVKEIRERRLGGIAIVRAPDPSEPELVGLG